MYKISHYWEIGRVCLLVLLLKQTYLIFNCYVDIGYFCQLHKPQFYGNLI